MRDILSYTSLTIIFAFVHRAPSRDILSYISLTIIFEFVHRASSRHIEVFMNRRECNFKYKYSIQTGWRTPGTWTSSEHDAYDWHVDIDLESMMSGFKQPPGK